jgi:hypothetical protein
MSRPASASMYTIDKLSRTNFSHWKFRITFVLKDRGLWEFVDPTTAEASTRTNPAGNTQALSQIVLTLSDDQLSLARGETSAAGAWRKICTQFEQRGLAQKIHLRRKLFNIKYKEGTTMQAHLNTFRDIVDQLEAIEFGVKDDDLAILALCSLPSRFDGLVIQLESMPAEQLTFATVSARLLSEYDRQAEALSTQFSPEPPTALTANTPRGDSFSSVCSYCGRPGHTEDGPGRKCWDKHGRQPVPPRQPRDSTPSNAFSAIDLEGRFPIEFTW